MTGGILATIRVEDPPRVKIDKVFCALSSLDEIPAKEISQMMTKLIDDFFGADVLMFGRELRSYCDKPATDGAVIRQSNLPAAFEEYTKRLARAIANSHVADSEAPDVLELARWLFELFGDYTKLETSGLLRTCGHWLSKETVEEFRQQMAVERPKIADLLVEGIIKPLGPNMVYETYLAAKTILSPKDEPDERTLRYDTARMKTIIEGLKMAIKENCEMYRQPSDDEKKERERLFRALVALIGSDYFKSWARDVLPEYALPEW